MTTVPHDARRATAMPCCPAPGHRARHGFRHAHQAATQSARPDHDARPACISRRPSGVAHRRCSAHADRHRARGRRRRGAEPGVGARDRSPDAPHAASGRCRRPTRRRRRHMVRRAAVAHRSRRAGARRQRSRRPRSPRPRSVSYVLVYTPLKTRTSLATLVGAMPGALPPVIGWAAATGDISLPALVLFGIVFFWQMPHFLAIAWMYPRRLRARGHSAAAGARA